MRVSLAISLELVIESANMLLREILTMNVLLDGLFSNGSGFAEDNLQLLSALVNIGSNVRILARDGIRDSRSKLARLSEQTLESNDVYISNLMCGIVEPNPNFRVNIARTTFETDRVPDQWVKNLNLFDELWVYSKFNLDVFIDSGVTVPIYVIPGTVDFSLYPLEGDIYPISAAGRFVFLSVFDWQLRKGYPILIRAFMEEFTKEDKVCTVIKTFTSDRSRDPVAELAQIMRVYDHGNSPPIYIINQMLVHSELVKLYRSADAFVLPSHGEGWGRPMFEAMTLQLPTIATAWGGHNDFMNESNSYPIAVEKIDEAVSEFSLFDGHKWAIPSVDDLKRKMRVVYKEKEQSKDKGRKARVDLLRDFNLDRVQHLISERLKTFI